jgi:HAD superfamily hydrolase (TIGR01509 family)
VRKHQPEIQYLKTSISEEQRTEVARRKGELYFDALPQLKAVPEVVERIDAQHGRIPFAVVSESTRDSVTASLRTLQLLEKFETLVCDGDYKRGKPDPEAFRIAAARLGVKPECCLVFGH